MVVVPATNPETLPVLFTTATDVLLLAHVPPVVRSVNATAKPSHTCVGPTIDVGNGFTVTVASVIQPVVGKV